mgnify:CR=1 FL=1
MPDKKLTYKEKNGTTRVGDALRWLVDNGKKVAPELLNIAGNITGIEGLENLANKIKGTTTLTEFDKKIVLEQLEMDKIEMQELTKRLQSDNEHPITRLVRPITYAFILLNMALLMYFDGNIGDFTVDAEWKPIIKNLAQVMTIFYFGSRGIEKVFKTLNKK